MLMMDDISLLREFFAREAPEEILAAYLFGSRARGTATPSSDIDVGIVLDGARRLDARARFSLRVDLTAMLIHAIRRNDVDVVLLNEAPPPLAAAILADGEILFCRDARRLQEFGRDVQLRAADLRPFLERMEARLLERLAAS